MKIWAIGVVLGLTRSSEAISTQAAIFNHVLKSYVQQKRQNSDSSDSDEDSDDQDLMLNDIPAHFSSSTDDLFMRSMITTYAIEDKAAHKFLLNKAATY